MATYKITLVSLNSTTNTANIDIQKDGGAVVHVVNVSGLPMDDQTAFIKAGEQYAIDYYNGLEAQKLPTINPAVTALVGQSATVVV